MTDKLSILHNAWANSKAKRSTTFVFIILIISIFASLLFLIPSSSGYYFEKLVSTIFPAMKQVVSIKYNNIIKK